MKSRTVALSAALVAAAGAGYVTRIAPRRLHVVRLRIALPLLPRQWDGVRIAHLSDFHAGGRGVTLRMVQDAKAHALAFQPDLVALSGDYFDQGVPIDTGDLFTSWPKGIPVVGVLGNHDYRGGRDNLVTTIEHLRAGGVQLLRNTAMQVKLRGTPAWIVGVDDPFTFQADEGQAFAALPDGAEALVYLAHSPVVSKTLPVGRARLLLSGHTHGGQVRLLPSGRLPLIVLLRKLMGTPARRESDIFHGYHWRRGAVVVISNGLGVSQLPVRFLAPPQVVLIELRAGATSGPACDDVRRYVEVL